MSTTGRVGMLVAERATGVALVGWLQLVGVLTHSVLHHILHALPLVLLLVWRPSPARNVTGLLAGYLWVFMLAAVTSMLHDALILGWIVSRPQVAYTWLAPGAAGLAVVWAACNAALLRPGRWTLPLGLLVGVTLALGLTAAQPYLSAAFEHPLEQTLAREYGWAAVLLLETAVVLALPVWAAVKLGGVKPSWRFALCQAAYWVFFVALMVAGLLPGVIRDRPG
jgi:vacuolar-type H+-ATPase subunit I/STV1